MQITWQELAVDLRGQSSEDLLSQWRWMTLESLTLRMVSTLGDAFLEDERGRIFWLDVGAAELSRIAASRAEFDALRQVPEHADRWFIPQLVGDLLCAGRVLQQGECFSYKIPPTLGGSLDPANFAACDLSVHFGALGQIQRQVRDLPAGTVIDRVVLGQ